MSAKYEELTVIVPASQYVRIEAAATEENRSLCAEASFLLSEWVLATPKAGTKKSHPEKKVNAGAVARHPEKKKRKVKAKGEAQA